MTIIKNLSINKQLDLAVLTALIETATEGKTNSDRIYQHTLALRNNWLNLKTRKSNDDAAIILGTTSRLKLDYKCLTEIISSKGYYRIHLERAEETLANLEDELIEAFDFEFSEDFAVQDLEKGDLSNISYVIDDCILPPSMLSTLALIAYEEYMIFTAP